MRSTPKSPGDLFKSSEYNGDIDGLATGENDVDNNNLALFRNESFADRVVSGLIWSLITGRTAQMSSGVIYYNGVRIPISAVGSKEFTASQDTYVDIVNNNTVLYPSVANGATAPALSSNAIRVAKVVTNTTNITSIFQLPNAYTNVDDTDGNGVIIYPTSARDNTREKATAIMVTRSADIVQSGNMWRQCGFDKIEANGGFKLGAAVDGYPIIVPHDGLYEIGGTVCIVDANPVNSVMHMGYTLNTNAANGSTGAVGIEKPYLYRLLGDTNPFCPPSSEVIRRLVAGTEIRFLYWVGNANNHRFKGPNSDGWNQSWAKVKYLGA